MLAQEIYSSIFEGLKSTEKEKITEACSEIRQNLKVLTPREQQAFADALVSLFYLDTTAHPEYAEVIDIAEDTLAMLGAEIVEILVENLTDADLEANFHIAHTLGKIGTPAVGILKNKFRNEPDPYGRALALLAMSKIDDPALIEIMPEVISALDHENPKLRSTAAQALGLMIDCHGGLCLTRESAQEAFEKLMAKLADPHAGTRARVIAALGRLARMEYLDDEHLDRATKAITGILGINGRHEWDRAFVVRKAAEETYQLLTGNRITGEISLAEPEPLVKEKFIPYSPPEDGILAGKFELLSKKELAPDTYELVFTAPLVARARKPGQFVIILAHQRAERIPISLKGGDADKGTITVIIQAVGKSSREVTAMEPGECVHSILGPLGEPTHILPGIGTAVCLGGGYGSGAILSVCNANRLAGNKSIAIIGARSKDLLLCVSEAKQVADEVYITTDDGSEGIKGFVTTALQQLIDKGEPVGWTFSVGPIPMMRAVANLTKPLGIPSYASLNAIMLDGTGMCGGCRVEIGGESKFACCHGPDFDSHKVNWENLIERTSTYKPQEKEIDELYRAGKLPSVDGIGSELKTPTIEELDKKYHATLPEEVTLNDLGPDLKGKMRMKIPRQMIPEQPPKQRIKNFDEVALGYCTEQAIVEANRCLQCKDPKCVPGCPVNIDIPAFITMIRDGDFLAANREILETNTFGAVCGRVCPQDQQCELTCILTKRGESVAIGRLERFASDYARMHEELYVPEIDPPTGKKIAVIGSGPAGLTCAGLMVQKGHDVTVFEALHRVGGVMVYGIPEFRLPNVIVDAEVAKLEKMGVKIVTNALIGQAYTIDELMEENGFDAIFLGTGAGLPWMLGIPGENNKGVYTANEFLTRVNLMRADLFPRYSTPVFIGQKAVIFGCGNTAMDAARTCKRIGQNSTIVYRRTRAEAPARTEEIEHAEQEGVEFRWLTAPVEVYGDQNGWVTGVRCVRMELGEPDASGRRRPVTIEGSEFDLDCDTIISALGFGVNPLIASTTPDLLTNKWGVLLADKATGRTSKRGVFAGGDSITGGATVILAMGQATVAAVSMHEYLTTGEWEDFKPA